MIHQAIHKTGSEQRTDQPKASAVSARSSDRAAQRQSDGTPQAGHNFADVAVHRPDHRPAANGQPQVPSNQTGLPDALKAGVEQLAGLSLDDVRVHYNSAKPAQLDALAYAQGRDIHVAPGEERHLPHEAWHVVQQAQGRVKPTMQMKEGVSVNDDQELEHEATVMGAKAVHGTGRQHDSSPDPAADLSKGAVGALNQTLPIQAIRTPPIDRKNRDDKDRREDEKKPGRQLGESREDWTSTYSDDGKDNESEDRGVSEDGPYYWGGDKEEMFKGESADNDNNAPAAASRSSEHSLQNSMEDVHRWLGGDGAGQDDDSGSEVLDWGNGEAETPDAPAQAGVPPKFGVAREKNVARLRLRATEVAKQVAERESRRHAAKEKFGRKLGLEDPGTLASKLVKNYGMLRQKARSKLDVKEKPDAGLAKVKRAMKTQQGYGGLSAERKAELTEHTLKMARSKEKNQRFQDQHNAPRAKLTRSQKRREEELKRELAEKLGRRQQEDKERERELAEKLRRRQQEDEERERNKDKPFNGQPPEDDDGEGI